MFGPVNLRSAFYYLGGWMKDYQGVGGAGSGGGCVLLVWVTRNEFDRTQCVTDSRSYTHRHTHTCFAPGLSTHICFLENKTYSITFPLVENWNCQFCYYPVKKGGRSCTQLMICVFDYIYSLRMEFGMPWSTQNYIHKMMFMSWQTQKARIIIQTDKYERHTLEFYYSLWSWRDKKI